MELIKKKIKDKLVLELLKTGLNAKVLIGTEKNNTISKTLRPDNMKPISGVPQGGILSPLLSNIYLHEFDTYMELLKMKFKGKSERPRANPLYMKLMRKNTNNWNPKLVRKLNISRTDPYDNNYRHIRYIRYADDFLIGVAGPRKLAKRIRNLIQKYLKEKLKLLLNMEKTRITNISKKVSFLSYKIGKQRLLGKTSYKGKRINRVFIIPTLDGDLLKMKNNLAKNGFCDPSGFPKPNFSLLMLPQSEINNRINSIIRGLSN
jgi:retron-type reverse transcriptase